MFRLGMDAEVCALLAHTPPELKRKMRESLRTIAADPGQGKALQGELLGLRSYRVGRVRIVYSIDERRRVVHIVAMGPRRTIYAELERAVRVRSMRRD